MNRMSRERALKSSSAVLNGGGEGGETNKFWAGDRWKG